MDRRRFCRNGYVDGLACARRRVFDHLCRYRGIPETVPARSSLVPHRRPAAPAACGRRHHCATPAHVGRMPMAVLGDACARAADVGHQRRRLVGRRDAAGRRHVVAGMARRVRALRRRRAAACAAGAAASGAARESHGDHRGRHRRHRRAHRISLFPFCRRGRSRSCRTRHVRIAVAALRASAVSRLHRHGDRRHVHARPRMETGVSAPCDRPVDLVHHADAGQRRNLAGLLSDARRLATRCGFCRLRSIHGRHPTRRDRTSRRSRPTKRSRIDVAAVGHLQRTRAAAAD